MSPHSQCPGCGHKAGTSFFTQGYIPLHKCRRCGGFFCNECGNGKRCPYCGSDSVWWNAEECWPRK